MGVEHFLTKYKFPILSYLLKDKDLNLSIYLNNNELPVNKIAKESNDSKMIIEPRRINKEELNAYISSRDSRDHDEFLTEQYLFSEDDIDFIKVKLNSFLDLSRAKGILWSDKLIEKYASDWNWSHISRNNSINWTKDKITKFEKYIDFASLSYNTNIELDINLIEKHENSWDWEGLSGNPGIIKNIEYELLNYPKTIWITKPNYRYGGIKSPLNSLNDIYISRYYGDWGINPCICTNPAIIWDVEKFNKYKDKIDLWLLALFGKLEIDLIYELGNEFNENRVYETNFTRHSDWRDEHPIYRNGWENLLLNENIKIDLSLLKYLHSQQVNLIDHNGNAMNGHFPYEVSKKASELISSHSLNISFSELCTYYSLLPESLLSETKINEDIFFRIIKPEFQKNNNLIKALIKEL